ncbi:hypothetical protein J7L06_06720 [Candidatus Bathyarchaeota archaeon]|nr:hypothetical protein [Candidatus Bathyarchaeota archaeon]
MTRDHNASLRHASRDSVLEPEGWYQIPIGDDDGEANGVIVDAGGPGIPSPAPTAPPVGGVILYPTGPKGAIGLRNPSASLDGPLGLAP